MHHYPLMLVRASRSLHDEVNIIYVRMRTGPANLRRDYRGEPLRHLKGVMTPREENSRRLPPMC